ncbi:AAA family ATPase [Candidatus Pacearchaeota archaeon]|nr:AAA family ATPase [Candidatus Pacearchaeota archaeon]
MIIKKIYLENIRSYKNGEIDFPKGSTLLSGDIGSGKTSVLLAIEFALFGLEKGSLSGNSLLRMGEKTGSVRLEMEIAGKNIIIERMLKKGKTSAAQEAGYISIDNEKYELSPTQLKQKVLELLNYPPDYLTKTNLLYRYTIYTPQESMREILLEKSELRTDTLRRIFGIDKYKAVAQNLGIFSSKLRESIRNKEGMIMDLESKKQEIEKKQQEISKFKAELETAKKELENLQSTLKEKKAEQEKIEKQAAEIAELKTEIAAKKSGINAAKEQLHHFLTEEKILNTQVKEQREETKNFRFQDIEQPRLEKEKLISGLETKRLSLEKEISALNHEKRQNENVKISISEVDVCPLCRQDVPHNHKLGIISKSNAEIGKLEANIRDKSLQKEALDKSISLQRKQISGLQTAEKEQIVMKNKISRTEEKENDLKKLQDTLEKTRDKLKISEAELQKLEDKTRDSAKFEEEYAKSKHEVEKAREQEKQAAISKARTEKEIENLQQTAVDLKGEIEQKEKIKADVANLNKLRKWLQDKFPAVLSAIEQAVMAKLHADFSMLFEKWFSMLVSELSVRLDENFTPIMESRGHELDYSFLSGGERTAVALAYRLALNQVINSFISKIRTREILILDEPTDGFSSEQLDKMRDVLIELNVKQLILVSHEFKIESFVENIIRFRKHDGITSVQK